MIARSARDNLTIEAGSADHDGRRHFTIKWCGEAFHHDVFNPFKEWCRGQCANSVFQKLEAQFSNGDVAQEQLAEMFGENPDSPNLTWIGDSLVAAASTAAEAEEGLEDTPPIAFDTLAEQHPRLAEPIIDGILRRGATANIVSSTKIGKSWLAYMLALCVRLGRYWLDVFPCRAGRVLFIDNELFPAEIVYRIQASANALGIQRHEFADGLDIVSLRGRLRDIFAVCKMLESIEPNTYDLIVFDALYRGLPPGTSENDNSAMAMIFNHIDRTVARLNCCWCNVHHSSKGDQGDKRVSDVGAGAGSQSRSVDAHIILREHEEKGVMVLEGAIRSFAPIEPLALRWCFPVWQPADGVDPAALKGKLSRAEQRSNERDEDGIEKLVTAFETASDPLSVRDLRRVLGSGKERCEKLLDRLETSGRIKRGTTNKRGNLCDEYWLASREKDVVRPRGTVVRDDVPRKRDVGRGTSPKGRRRTTTPDVVRDGIDEYTTSPKKTTKRTRRKVATSDGDTAE